MKRLRGIQPLKIEKKANTARNWSNANQKLQHLLKIHKTTQRPGEGQMSWSSYVPRYLTLALKTLQAPRPKLELFRRHHGFLHLAISNPKIPKENPEDCPTNPVAWEMLGNWSLGWWDDGDDGFNFFGNVHQQSPMWVKPCVGCHIHSK